MTQTAAEIYNDLSRLFGEDTRVEAYTLSPQTPRRVLPVTETDQNEPHGTGFLFGQGTMIGFTNDRGTPNPLTVHIVTDAGDKAVARYTSVTPDDIRNLITELEGLIA